ncbi:MAG: malectin, partial [Armatimonadota bacterium]|nr:malectin [Armatimonadota bacterium]
MIDNVRIVPTGSIPVANFSFETPLLNNGNPETWQPSGASWTFAGNSGTALGTYFNGPAQQAPDGAQVGYLGCSGQSLGIIGSSISQTISGFQPGGSYSLIVAGAQRQTNTSGTAQPVQVTLNGSPLGTGVFTPGAFGYQDYVLGPFTANSGSQALSFLAPSTGPANDAVAMIDNVRVLFLSPVFTGGLRIDAGSTSAYSDLQGKSWAADYGATGGTTATTGTAINGTSDSALYQTQRVGSSFSYALSVPNGKYALSLLFAETAASVTGSGQRVFNVTANGSPLLTDFDIYAAAGANTAVTKSFLVSVTNGQLALAFTGTTAQAAVAGISLTLPGGTPAMDIPPPGWAEDVIPSDSSDADGSGPSASESVSLPSGVKENNPGPDLDVFNPMGPSISYSRRYRSALAAAGIYTPGLSPGWRDNYSLTVSALGGGNYTLNYPNGAVESWTTTGGTINPPLGAPYLVSASGGSLTMTFKDHSYETFTPDPNNANNFLLTGLSNLAGGTVAISRDPANGNRITTLSNAAGPLLTLNYNGALLSGITDVYGQAVTYGFASGSLSTVSQVNAPGTIRWQYGYQTISGQPFLNAVQTPDPSSGGMSEADTQYTTDGHVALLKDAEGNQRVYSYGPSAATVSIYGADGTLAQTWTQKFDPANHNVDKGIIDANGHATTLVYGDAVNPMKVTAATNKNNQTAYAAFDRYGNT